MLLPIANVQPVPSVTSATDEQFQAFISAAGIPVEDGGIAEWSFDDRLDVLCHALTYGLVGLSDDAKQFVLPKQKSSELLEKNSDSGIDSELMEATQLPSQDGSEESETDHAS